MSTSLCSCSYAPCCLPRPAHGTRQALCWRLPRRRERRQQSSQAEPGEGRGGGGLDSSREVAVPWEQRPVNELAQLRESWLFSWVSSCLLCCGFATSAQAYSLKNPGCFGECVTSATALLPFTLIQLTLTGAQATLSLPEYIKRVRILVISLYFIQARAKLLQNLVQYVGQWAHCVAALCSWPSCFLQYTAWSARQWPSRRLIRDNSPVSFC